MKTKSKISIGIAGALLVAIIFLSYIISHSHLTPRIPKNEENAFYFINDILDPKVPLEEHLGRFHDINSYQEMYVPSRSERLNCLEWQIFAKLVLVYSVFDMIQGNRERALDLLMANYRMGLLMNRANEVITPLIGVAIREMTSRILLIYALNACETSEELKAFYRCLEAYDKTLNRDYFCRNYRREYPVYYPNVLMHYSSHKRILHEGGIREHVADVHFELVKAATAARYFYLERGKFPSGWNDLAILLSPDSCRDPFSRDSLRYLFNAEKKTFVVYSIGPDEVDNGAAFPYDPTNGTDSPGDIFATIPEKRIYPLPRQGARADSFDEFMEIFPKGLPFDYFSDSKKGLNVSRTVPVMIYSFGPDTDEMERLSSGTISKPEVMYDPTNGVVSDGDLWIVIPPSSGFL